ncbi:MAG: hypothetical protein N2Z20_01665 [Elusimicrobiales bacterium]|nr:hypothetical protein [Elusimicrobiales bacterium]
MKGICFELYSSGAGFCLFGATGNLARKKIIPALCNMFIKEYVRENFFVLNIGSRDYDDDSFRKYIIEILNENGIKEYESFVSRNYYLKIDYSLKSYIELKKRFEELCKIYLTNSKIFYLSIIPLEIKNTIKRLFLTNIIDNNSKIVIEKPYGNDFKDACYLVEYFKKEKLEDYVYRIDHYTGKTGIINILLTRLLNYAFEKTFNSDFIDNIQITIYEDIGVEERVNYFNSMGIFKDMFFHVIQIVSFIAMDLPSDLKSDLVRERKISLVNNIIVPEVDEIQNNWIRGQYSSYRSHLGINSNSETETFIAFKFFINEVRWHGVPFYVKIGKKMKERVTRVDVIYKKLQSGFSEKYSINSSNILTFYIQPEIKIEFSFLGKLPGPKFCVSEYKLFSKISENLSMLVPSDYERLILDCINGDKTLFVSSNEVKKIWNFIKIYDDAVKDRKIPLCFYIDGNICKTSKKVVEMDGKQWVYI